MALTCIGAIRPHPISAALVLCCLIVSSGKRATIASGDPSERAVRRVLFVVNAYPDPVRPYYGAYIKLQADALRRAGLAVDVLAVRGYVGKREYLKGGLRALALNLRAPYDVVHAHYGLMGLVARLQLRAPLVVSFTGGDIQGDPDRSGRYTRSVQIRTRACRAAARFAHATITKSQAMAEVLPPSCRHRNHVVPTGVDLHRFRRLPREEARTRLGWDPDEPTVIFVADTERPVKNFPLAKAAVERLRRSLPGTRLRVAETVIPEEVPLWMAAADALILTSRSEGSPNVIKEAMAAELPAVSTPVGDVPERFEGVPGCFIRPPEPEALAKALAAAIAHGRTPEARKAVSSVSIERMVAQVMDIYESVARGPRST
jgi:teichuronic acid biosynthesis glycosyltransferase TuaC